MNVVNVTDKKVFGTPAMRFSWPGRWGGASVPDRRLVGANA
jgi:hypothetical protein